MKEKENNISAEKFLILESELSIYKKMMGEASDVIMDQDITEYPIFVAHQQDLEIGIILAEIGKVKGNWNIHATTMEEMVYKQIIQEANIEEFKRVYKDPAHHLCVFVLSELGAQFIFLKR